MQWLHMASWEMDISSHSKLATWAIKAQFVLALHHLLELHTSLVQTAANWMHPVHLSPGIPDSPTALGAESWCHALKSHWKVFYHIPAPMEKSSSNYWKQIYFCLVAWMLKGHCCLGPCYTKKPKFFHIRSKSHCAIEVPHSWQMPKPIIAPTAMTKIIIAFPSVKCVPCSVSYLK